MKSYHYIIYNEYNNESKGECRVVVTRGWVGVGNMHVVIGKKTEQRKKRRNVTFT